MRVTALLVRMVVCVALVAGTTLVVVNRPVPGTPARPVASAPAGLPDPGGVQPPSSGLYLGAAVNIEPGQGLQSPIQAYARFEDQTGRELPLHRMYLQWSGPTVSALTRWDLAGGRIPVLSLNAPPRWSEIASGQHDAEIIAQAQALKALGAPVSLTFNHEPELDTPQLGTPADYVAAWRHWVDVYREQGATNVSFTWILLAATFNKPALANSYYPGDDYVDWLGVDGYNWFTVCKTFAWRSFSTVFAGFRTWAAKKAKPAMITEVGSAEDSADPERKAEWIRDMGTTLAGWPQVKGVAWFNWYPQQRADGKDCEFRVVTSTPSLDAWRALAALPFTQSRPVR